MLLHAALSGLVLSTSLLAVDPAVAGLSVEISATRTILPVSGWSAVETYVSNTGPAPAAGVTVSTTLPAGLPLMSTETTSEWDCDGQYPVLTCAYRGDLAPGERKRALLLSVRVEGLTPGTVVTASASGTTSTPEDSTGDNSAEQTIRIVDSGVVQGGIWNDLNADGLRQPTEPPAEDVGMSIISLDDEDRYGFSNAYRGRYSELLPVKRFRISTDLNRSSWRFTTPGGDSDLRPVSQDTSRVHGESDVFTVDPATPTVIDLGVVAAFRPTKISPKKAATGAPVKVTLVGEAFRDSQTVRLTRPGFAPITGTIKKITDDRTRMRVEFPLTAAEPGPWSLSVAAQFGAAAEVADAFTVTPN